MKRRKRHTQSHRNASTVADRFWAYLRAYARRCRHTYFIIFNI